MNKLKNKVALITGASSGIGEAIAKLFVAEGAKVALAARTLPKLQKLAQSLGPASIAVRADMSNRADILEMAEATVRHFGRVDILINNAGVGMYASFASSPPERLEQLVTTNWLGPAFAAQAVIPHMRKQGSGQIINISSVAGKVPLPWMTTYCSTKFALNALSYGLRMELAEDNIQVISVCPGRIKTPFTENAYKDSWTSPLKPGGISPERVARAVVRASLRNPREIIVPADNWSFVWLHALWPGFIERMTLRVLRRGMRPGR